MTTRNGQVAPTVTRPQAPGTTSDEPTTIADVLPKFGQNLQSKGRETATPKLAAIADQIEREQDISWKKARQQAEGQHPELVAEARREAEERRQQAIEREREEAERQRQQRREQLQNEFWPNLARGHSGSRLDNFAFHGSPKERGSQRKIIEALRNLDLQESIESGQNILFIGPCGTGKDHLMHALAYQSLFTLGWAIQIKNGSSLRRELKHAAMAELGEREIIRRLAETKLLCLSDPIPGGGTELTEFQADALYDIVDRRWNAGLPIWLTANLPIEKTGGEASRILTTPVWDRLRDSALIIHCFWSSYRRHSKIIE